jgi:tetratricopeptide (TPR) repeat protein
MAKRLARVGLCALVIMSAPIRAGLASRGQADTGAYRAIVADYGRADATALPRLERLSPADLAAAVRRATQAEGDAWPWESQRLAAMLHTEVWVRCMLAKCAADLDAHLDHAERLLDAVRQAAPRQHGFVERWQVTMAGLLDRFDRPRAAATLLTKVRERTTTDERVTRAYTRGLAQEWDGSLEGQVRAFVPIGSLAWSDRFQSRYWLAAAEAYADALRRSPDYRPAALHLGRVRMLQGDLQAAAALFERARQSDDPRLVYLAALFGGSLAELDEAFGRAEALYRQALEAYPTGQSAAMALSHLLGRLGRDREAEDALLRILAADARVVDPLWTYLPPPWTELGYLLGDVDLLIAEVVR